MTLRFCVRTIAILRFRFVSGDGQATESLRPPEYARTGKLANPAAPK